MLPSPTPNMPPMIHTRRVASTKAEEMAGLLSKAVAAHKVARVQARVRRHVGGSNVGKTELDGVGMAAKGVMEGV